MRRVLFLVLLCGAVGCKKLQTVLDVSRADQPICMILRQPDLPKCKETKVPEDGSAVVVKNLKMDNVMIFNSDLMRIKKFEKLATNAAKPTIIIHKNVTSSYTGYIVANKCVPRTDISLCNKLQYNKKKKKLLDQLAVIRGVNTTVVNESGHYHTTDLMFINVNIFL